MVTLLTKKVITGIDLNSSGIRLVQVKKRGKTFKIISSYSQLFKTGESKEIENVLKELSLKYSLHRATVVAGIPRHDAIVKYLTLPSVDKCEIEKMMSYEIRRQITVPVEQLSVDYELITRAGYESREGETGSEIMLAAAKNQVIEKHIEFFQRAGIEPEIVTINSLAVYNAFVESYPEFVQTAVVVNVSIEETDFVFITEGRFLLKYSRSISSTGGWLKPEKVLSELTHTLGFFGSEKRFLNQPVKKIFFCTDENKKQEYFEFIKQNLDIEVELFRNFPLLERGIKGDFRNAPHPVAYGLALIGAKKTDVLNLLPPEIKREHQQKAGKRRIITSAAAGLILLVFTAVIITGTLRKDIHQVKKISAEIKKMQLKTAELEEIYNKIQLINNYSGGTYSPVNVLKQVNSLINKRIVLTSFVYDKNKSVNIKGFAESYSSAVGFLSALEKSGYFLSVVDKGSRQETIDDLGEKRSFVEFNIECIFK